MMHPEIAAALSRERVSTFLAEAEAARRAAQARSGRPRAAGRGARGLLPRWLPRFRSGRGRPAESPPVSLA
jgi:hypothetical protein